MISETEGYYHLSNKADEGPKEDDTELIVPQNIQQKSSEEWQGRELIPLNTSDSLHHQPKARSIVSLFYSFYSRFQSRPHIEISDSRKPKSYLKRRKSSTVVVSESFYIDKELPHILKLPIDVKKLINDFIDPLDYIETLMYQGTEIPDYLKHNAKRITNLDLSKTKLSISHIPKLLEYFKNLQTLKIPMRTMISEDDPMLKRMTDRIIVQLCEDVITSIANLENLKKLDMPWSCFAVDILRPSDKIIKQLVSKGKLQYLNLEGCSFLTDKGISFIVAKCKDLQHLNLKGFKKTSDLVPYLIRELPNLTYLELGGNGVFTCAKIADLRLLFNMQDLRMP